MLSILLAAAAAPASFTADKAQLLCRTGGQQAATWSGACKDGMADGAGVVEWREKTGPAFRIEGTLAGGTIVGSAEMHFGSASYSGTFRHFLPHGEGFYMLADGTMYEGGLADGKPNGHGVRQEPDRSRYDGNWVAGKREGHGKATYALGGSYDGQWHNDRFDGAGTIVYAGSGRTFTGQFQDGQVTGATAPAEGQTVRYQYRDDLPHVGSLLRDMVADSDLPAAPWVDMTAEQRAAYSAQYRALEAGDEPPYPAKGMRQVALLIRKVHSAFPDYKGRVRVLVMVGADGKAESVTTIGKVPADVTKYVSSALVVTPYKPAVCHGAPCAMPFSVAFVLD